MADYWGRGEGLKKVMREKLEARDHQIELIDKFFDLYRDAGVLMPGGSPKQLCNACDKHTVCWPKELRRPGSGDDAGVSVPWVGPGYKESQVCVLGLNGNKYGNLGATWWITKSDIEARRGNSTVGGEPTKRQRFYRGAGRCLAVLSSETNDAGGLITDSQCADLWDRAAFMEAVKCGRWTSSRGSPTPTMLETCPPRYLSSELEILEPKTVLVVGRQAWGPVAAALGAADFDWNRPAARATGSVAGSKIDLYFVVHPAARGDQFNDSVSELARIV